MSNQIVEIKKALGTMSAREKKLFAATLLTLFCYLFYVLVFQSTFQKIITTSKSILALSTELDSLKSIRQEVKMLSKKALYLHDEIEKKEKESKALAEGMKARNQIHNLLKTLESTADDSKLRLNKLQIKTSVIRKSKNFKVETLLLEGGGADNPQPANNEKDANTKSVKVTYIHNKISLSSYSTYKQILVYLKKIRELPYAISFENIEMSIVKRESAKTPQVTTPKKSGSITAKSSKASKTTEMPKGFLETKIRMEIFFK